MQAKAASGPLRSSPSWRAEISDRPQDQSRRNRQFEWQEGEAESAADRTARCGQRLMQPWRRRPRNAACRSRLCSAASEGRLQGRHRSMRGDVAHRPGTTAPMREICRPSILVSWAAKLVRSRRRTASASAAACLVRHHKLQGSVSIGIDELSSLKPLSVVVLRPSGTRANLPARSAFISPPTNLTMAKPKSRLSTYGGTIPQSFMVAARTVNRQNPPEYLVNCKATPGSPSPPFSRQREDRRERIEGRQ